MKKVAIALAAVLGVSAAQAQMYGTVALGSGHLEIDCAGLDSCKTNHLAAKLTAGYQLGEFISLQAGYINFGKFQTKFGSLTDTAKSSALTLGAAFSAPLDEKWGWTARLGAARVRTQVTEQLSTTTLSDSETKTKVYAGLSMTYSLSKSTRLEMGVDTTRAEYGGGQGNLRLISLGATFGF